MAKINLYAKIRKSKLGYPVIIMLRHRNSVVEVPTGVYISDREKLTTNPNKPVPASERNSARLNKQLVGMFSQMQTVIFDLERTGSIVNMTANDIVNRCHDVAADNIRRASGHLITELLDEYARTHPAAESTEGTRRTTRKLVIKYLGSRCYADELTLADIQQFDQHMTEEGLIKHSDGLSVNTRAIHHANLKAALQYALDNEQINRNPYRRFTIKHEVSDKDALTDAEVRTIIQLHVPQNGPRGVRMETALDMWRLCFLLAGINLKDLYLLKKEQIQDGVISFGRSKNGRRANLFVLKEVREILDKYPSDDEYVLPFHGRTYGDFDQNWRNSIRKALNLAHKLIPEVRNIGISYARTSWPTIADDLGIDERDWDMSMAHAPQSTGARFYAKYQWDRTFAAQRKVADYILYGIGERKSSVRMRY